MYSESVYQVARSWVDVGSFDKLLVVRFMIFTASVRNILDKSSSLTQCNPSFLTQSAQLIFSSTTLQNFLFIFGLLYEVS
jgi:hypothetical protein